MYTTFTYCSKKLIQNVERERERMFNVETNILFLSKQILKQYIMSVSLRHFLTLWELRFRITFIAKLHQ